MKAVVDDEEIMEMNQLISRTLLYEEVMFVAMISLFSETLQSYGHMAWVFLMSSTSTSVRY